MQVRIASLNPQAYRSVAVVEVSLDDPTGWPLVFTSDLEPISNYSYAVEFRSSDATRASYNSSDETIIVGTMGASSYPLCGYSNQPLALWSANNLTFEQYLATDTLDRQV